jgi:enoyl-CoA hydratase/carnithine racemase
LINDKTKNEMKEDLFVRCERETRYALVAIDRRERENALNQVLIEQLLRVFAELRDDPDVRAVILTGAGDGPFSVGADHAELAGYSPEQAALYARSAGELAALIEGLGKPVIAAINGLASGGGCELALLCTWRIASAGAQFAIPDVRCGLIPGWGGCTRLPRVIGKSRAIEMILTGDPIGAEEAFRIGLVDRVVRDGEELIRSCVEIARRVGRNAPLAVKYALEAVNRGAEGSLNEGLQLESALFGLCFATGDFREGVRAFLEKREPEFKGN